MDVIIVCHTEFGQVRNKTVVADKHAITGVNKAVPNLIKVSEKYSAKITFAVMPEVVKYFPKDNVHEIGVHIHPGWKQSYHEGISYFVGDSYLRKHCNQSSDSTILRDFSFKEQLDMIKTGKDYISEYFECEPKTFVAGRWSINNNTVQALIQTGLTHDCSAPAHNQAPHHDWSRLPRICMPYHPDVSDYQKKGNLSVLLVPVSQMLLFGNVNPEEASLYGLSWLKASFLEYYLQGLPLFHICLHSPCMSEPYFISIMEEFLHFISSRKNITFKFASEIKEYPRVKPISNILPYFYAMNTKLLTNFIKSKLKEVNLK